MSTLSDEVRSRRFEYLRHTFKWSPLEDVAEAVSAASEKQKVLYVERRGDEYRWSLSHSGGAYPLMRITANFLGVDSGRLVIGFRTLDTGLAVLSEGGEDQTPPDEWAVLELARVVNATEASRRIVGALRQE